MVDLRDNIGWLIGAIGGVGAIILGYLQQYEFLGAILATTIGAGIAYFVQTKTQEKTWKREYSVRIVEEVYSILFGEIKSVLIPLENVWYRQYSFDAWREMQDDHRHLMVDKKFREKLDRFLEGIGNLSNDLYRIRTEILPKIMEKEGERLFKTNVEGDIIKIGFQFKKKKQIAWQDFDICESLVSRLNPKDALSKEHPDAEILEERLIIGSSPANSAQLEKIWDYWESCVKLRDEDKKIQSFLKNVDSLTKEANSIKKELEKRIEEPWKI